MSTQALPSDHVSDPIDLPYDELNPSGESTILFVHGASSSRLDWNLVTPYLVDKYHVLVPDLPGHGSARQHHPGFSKELAARLISNLIRTKARNGRAHLVGLSLGAQVAVYLASIYPELVSDVFVSGFTTYTNIAPQKAAYGLYADSAGASLVPKPLLRWLMDGTIYPSSPPDTVKPTFQLYRDIANSLCVKPWPESWPARTLIIAAGKAGILPTSDSREDATGLRDIGREKNGETIAFMHPRMRHPWNRQDPKLFATTARKWFEHQPISPDFVEL